MGQTLSVSSGLNVQAMRQADVVILGCKPHMAPELLQANGVREALENKLVISILAGTPVALLRRYIDGEMSSPEDCTKTAWIVRAIPNLGAQFKASMTLAEESASPMPRRFADIVNWIFGQIGRVKYIPKSSFDVATAVVTASIAVTSMLVDGIIDGAVAEGLKRSEALEIAAQGLQAVARLLLDDPLGRPSTILERMFSPRGVTIQAVLTAEKGALRRLGADTVMNSTQHLQLMSIPPKGSSEVAALNT